MLSAASPHAGNRCGKTRQQAGDPCSQTEADLLAVVTACGAASDHRRIAGWADRAGQTERLRARLARLSAGGDALSPAAASVQYPFYGPQHTGRAGSAWDGGRGVPPSGGGLVDGYSRAGGASQDVAPAVPAGYPRTPRGVYECMKAPPAPGCGGAWSRGGSRLGSLDFPDTPVPAAASAAAGARNRSWSMTSSISVQSDVLAALVESNSAAHSILAAHHMAREQQHQHQHQQRSQQMHQQQKQHQQHQQEHQGARYYAQHHGQQQDRQQRRRLATASASDGLCGRYVEGSAERRGPSCGTVSMGDVSVTDPPHLPSAWCTSLSWSSGIPMDIGAGEAV